MEKEVCLFGFIWVEKKKEGLTLVYISGLIISKMIANRQLLSGINVLVFFSDIGKGSFLMKIFVFVNVRISVV